MRHTIENWQNLGFDGDGIKVAHLYLAFPYKWMENTTFTTMVYLENGHLFWTQIAYHCREKT